MTVKKISDSDKRDILNLYRQTGETTSTLAERYGVSNSTISRLLKSTLPEEEYETLIASKRAARVFSYTDARQTPLFSDLELDVSVADPLVELKPNSETPESTPAVSQLETETPTKAKAQLNPDDAPVVTTSSSATPLTQDSGSNPVVPPKLLYVPAETIADSSTTPLTQAPGSTSVSPPQLLNIPAETIADSSTTPLTQDSGAQASALAQMLGEDLLDESEDLEESEDLTDLDDEDLEDLDEDDLEEDAPIVKRRLSAETLVQVLPLSEATLPKTCYLVIDRLSELITRPLRDFGDLGQIPTQEVQQKTLPVFDNHRVARRFSTKRDRVIKVPDSRMLQKTRSHLQAKGITRLLIDGQVYSLSNN